MSLITIYYISIPVTAVLSMAIYRALYGPVLVRDVITAFVIGAVPVINIMVLLAAAAEFFQKSEWLHKVLDVKLF